MNKQATPDFVDILPKYKKRQRSNSLANRLGAGTCEICGLKTGNPLMHHVKKLKSSKKNIFTSAKCRKLGGNSLTYWA